MAGDSDAHSIPKQQRVRSTRIRGHIKAPRGVVYRALVEAGAIAKWKVPAGMTCQVHAFDARVGGS